MNTLWQAFTPDETDDVIVCAFEKRWGAAPAMIIRERSLTLAGPVPDPLSSDEDADPRINPEWGVPGV